MAESNCKTNLTVRSFAAQLLEEQRRCNNGENVTLESLVCPSTGSSSQNGTKAPVVIDRLMSLTGIHRATLASGSMRRLSLQRTSVASSGASNDGGTSVIRPMRRHSSMIDIGSSHGRRRMSMTDTLDQTSHARRGSLSSSVHSVRSAPPSSYSQAKASNNNNRVFQRWSKKKSFGDDGDDDDKSSSEDPLALWRKAAGRSSRSLGSVCSTAVSSSESLTGEPNIAACQIGDEEERVGPRTSEEVRKIRARRISINRCIEVAFQQQQDGPEEPTEEPALSSVSSQHRAPLSRHPHRHNYEENRMVSMPFDSFSKSLDEIEFKTLLKGAGNNDDDDDDASILSEDSFASDGGILLQADLEEPTHSELEAQLLEDMAQDSRLLS